MTADQRSWLRAAVSVVAYLAACFGLVVIGRGPLIVRVMAVFAVGLLASRLDGLARPHTTRAARPRSGYAITESDVQAHKASGSGSLPARRYDVRYR